MDKSRSDLLLEEAIRRRDAGEFSTLPTWADLEGLDPESIKYGLVRSRIDPEYRQQLLKKAHESTKSSRAIEYRALRGLPPLYR